jgi:hypothetical protein
MTGEMRKVSEISRRQIVHSKNGVAVAQQAVAKVGTKKPGGAGNENMHGQDSVLQKQLSVISGQFKIRNSQLSVISYRRCRSSP